MSQFREDQDTSRLWCFALLNTLSMDDVAKVLGKYIEIRDDDPDGKLDELRS